MYAKKNLRNFQQFQVAQCINLCVLSLYHKISMTTWGNWKGQHSQVYHISVHDSGQVECKEVFTLVLGVCIYLCIYVYVYIYVCVCVHARTCVCVCIWVIHTHSNSSFPILSNVYVTELP